MLFLDPDNKEAHLRGVQIALKTSDISLAISHLQQSLRAEWIVEEDKLLSELILQKGLINIQIGGTESINSVIKSRGDFKNRSQEFYEAIAYLLGNRKSEALKVINRMIEDNPRNIEAFILKAKTLWSQEKQVEGNKFMWEAFMIDPKHDEVKEFLEFVQPKIDDVMDKASKDILSGKYMESLTHLKLG